MDACLSSRDKDFICLQPGGWRGRGKTNASEESPPVRTANTENKKNIVRIVPSYFSHPDSVEVRRGQVVQVIDVQQLLLKLFFFFRFRGHYQNE